jgi:hypothetical protein
MSRNHYPSSRKLMLAAAVVALVACGVAFADDTSTSRFGGDGYAYFNQPIRATSASTWRQSHPNGMTQRDLQAASSSSLAASASQFDNANIFTGPPSDPSWRQTHPNGLTNRELQAAGASSLAAWQSPNEPEPASASGTVAQSKATSPARK